MPHSPVVMLYLFHLHVFLSILALLGVFLFHHWAVRALTAPQLRRLALWCVGLGTAGIVVTVPFCLAGWRLMAGHVS